MTQSHLQAKYRLLEKDDAFKDLIAKAQEFVDQTMSDLSSQMSGEMTEEDKNLVVLRATQKKFRQETLDYIITRLKNSV